MTKSSSSSHRSRGRSIVIVVIVLNATMTTFVSMTRCPPPILTSHAFSVTTTTTTTTTAAIAAARHRIRDRRHENDGCAASRRPSSAHGGRADYYYYDDDDGKNADEDGDVARGDDGGGYGIRLNKVLRATHSRRAADEIIKSGRVSINDVVVSGSRYDVGTRVVPYRDVVKLDGHVVVGWEGMNAMTMPAPSSSSSSSSLRRMSRERLRSTMDAFEYVKYHKPLGVTCTTDHRVSDNILDSIRTKGYVPRHRVFPVGRLDRETSGLILLTSDGRVINSVLRGERKLPKVYDVTVDGELGESDLRSLRVSCSMCE